MHIIVPIKQIPETSNVRLDEETGTMVREGVAAIVNPLDLYAVEAALQLCSERGGQVTAVSMGPPSAESALREVLAMGVDRAVLISDGALAGSDTWCTAYALAAGVRRMGPFDLVLCGERAADGDTGQVGPALAAFLDLPVLTYVSCIESCTDTRVQVLRLTEHGYECLEADLPAVLTVVKEIAWPRLPTLEGKLRAREADVPVWSCADLGLDPDEVGLRGSPTRVVKVFRPRVARQGEIISVEDEAGAAQAAERIVRFLEQHGFVES